jgi:signal transduction histidine kinase
VKQLGEWVRRGRPRTVRARLALLYTGLFVASGAVLLGITYGLVAASLPVRAAVSTSSKAAQTALDQACKEHPQSGKSSAVSGKQPLPEPSPLACEKAYQAGANRAANAQRDRTLHDLLLYSLLGLGAVGVASAGLGWVVAGRVLNPVRAITAAARRASEHQLGERLALAGPDDELKELADTFDQMLDRLDAAFASQRRFVADASHELRTPLTVMQTAIDVTMAKPARSAEQLEAMAAKLRRSIAQARSLIDSLLTLATSQTELTNREPVDLATVAEDYIDTVGPAIVEHHLRAETELGPAETLGDAVLLERMVANLVDNAVRHNRPDGWLRISTSRDGHTVRLNVINTGPLIPADQVPFLFQPFWRMEERTSNLEGVGLGMAIVKSIAAAHGGTVDACSRPEGGLEITVWMPAAAPGLPGRQQLERHPDK